jgi:predicted O-linked N-acetylglucosamine transferase (SPINDLY family)
MSYKINEFDKLYATVLGGGSTNECAIDLYNLGVTIVMESENTMFQEGILSKLLFLFPEEYKLYHLMGIVFEKTAPYKSGMWLKLCNIKNPEFIENVISLSLYYFKNQLIHQFMDLNKNNIFDKIIDSPHDVSTFLNIYINNYIQLNMFKNVDKCLLKLIQQNCRKKCVSQEEKMGKWWTYHHLGYCYIVLSENKKAIEYTSKAVDLADKFGLSLENKLLSFQNMLAFYDFVYNDADENYKRYMKINDYLPSIEMFRHAPRKPGDKIRVGYVSSDFTHHPVSNFIAPIMQHYNRDLFEIVLFPNMESLSPEYSAFIENSNIKSRIIFGMPNLNAANLVYSEKIDILVDLNGHTTNNRLGIFAYNPAPFQVTYLGYPNTTGLESIKYRITDGVADKLDSVQKYSEKLVRMPKCFLNFQSIHQQRPTVPKLTDPNNIILGALNKEKKNSIHVLAAWRRVMNECPNTTIMIKMETFDNVEERTRFYMEHLGIDSSRMIIFPKLMNHDYDVLFSRIDIVIDTWPYSGTTTTCETLFNSVPMVTMEHRDYHCHNVSASLLVNSGLPELVATSPDDYVEKIKELVNNPGRIDEYKRTISDKFIKGMEPGPFMRDYEKIMVDIYDGKI